MQMYAPIYNRLCGWAFFTLGIIGFTAGHLGTYIRFSVPESALCTTVGLLGMVAARLRRRDAAVFALLFGVGLFAIGLAGLIWPVSWFGTSEPLENAVRLVAGLWGMYSAVTDVLAWRSSLTDTP
jgi:4-amino-4-deoxy-L-arabinose transferase-like glycosyltransferase